MSTTSDAFNDLIVKEFMLEPGLRDEFGIGATPAEWARTFSPQVVEYLAKTLRSSMTVPIPQTVIDEVGRYVSEQSPSFIMGAVRGIADMLAGMKSREDKYRSGCRSALSYAVMGSYKAAMDALHLSTEGMEGHVRHHHIYGLIHGVSGRKSEAKYELETALRLKSDAELRSRIQTALNLVR